MSTYHWKCESASRRFQPGESPSRGLLRDYTTSPINRFAALLLEEWQRSVGVKHSQSSKLLLVETCWWGSGNLDFSRVRDRTYIWIPERIVENPDVSQAGLHAGRGGVGHQGGVQGPPAVGEVRGRGAMASQEEEGGDQQRPVRHLLLLPLLSWEH